MGKNLEKSSIKQLNSHEQKAYSKAVELLVEIAKSAERKKLDLTTLKEKGFDTLLNQILPNMPILFTRDMKQLTEGMAVLKAEIQGDLSVEQRIPLSKKIKEIIAKIAEKCR